MKRKSLFIILMAFVFMFAGCSKTTYTFALADDENISRIVFDKGGDIRTIKKAENIIAATSIFKGDGRTTTKGYIPEGDYIKVNIVSGDSDVCLYIYRKGDKYYMGQSGGGLYEITDDDFKAVDDFYTQLKQEVTGLYKDNLISAVKKLNPVDEHGKSFKPSELSNRELLRYGFLQFNPKGNGFIDISFETLNRTYIKGSFGIQTATAEDITCSCGQVIAKYNGATDTFTWDKAFHYIDHKSDTFNEIKDIYRIEDTYYVELYKIFPSLMMNSSTEQYSFYATYDDAKNLAEPLFTVTNADEFTNAVNTLDNSVKIVYRLTFIRDGGYKLTDYEILN